jgi:hypothetical protein
MPDIGAAARRAHPNEDLVLADHRILDAAELQYIGGTKSILNDCFRGDSP